MTANAALLLFVIAFWSTFSAAAKLSNWRAGKRWADGACLFPMIPVIAMVALGIGMVINQTIPPWGSWGIAGLHVCLLVGSLMFIQDHSPP